MLIGYVIPELMFFELFAAYFTLVKLLRAFLQMKLQVALLDAGAAPERTVDLELADQLLNGTAYSELLRERLLAIGALPLREPVEALLAHDCAAGIAI